MNRYMSPFLLLLKKEFIGPGLHLRPVCADHAWLPLQWTLNSLLSACGNNNGRVRPPLDRGILKITSRLITAEEETYRNNPCLQKGNKHFPYVSGCNHRLIYY